MTGGPILEAMSDLPTISADAAHRLWAGARATDRDVERCEAEHGGLHPWVTARVQYAEVFEIVSFCKSCGVRMCGAVIVEDDPDTLCLLAMGHPTRVLHRNGLLWREVEKVRSLT